MKKIISLILALNIIVLSFCSCTSSGTELSKLMIIQGIGIDEYDGEIKVTVEVLNNEVNGSPKEASGSYTTKLYTATGETVAMALRSLTLKSGNSPLFAHNRVIIIGENALNKKLSNLLDFFVRNYDSRASELICVSKNMSAEKLLKANAIKDAVKSEHIENMLNKACENSLIPKIRVIDAINSLKSETDLTFLPCITLADNKNYKDFKLWGGAILDKDETFSKYLSLDEIEGLLFLDNKINRGFFTAKLLNGENANFVINSSKTKYKIYEENGELIYKLYLKISCDLEEVEGANYFSTDSDFMEKLKTSASLTIGKKIENTFKSLQQESAGDIVRFGKRLRLYNNKLYLKYKNNWDKNFKNIKCSATVKVTIRRIGEETFHSKKK